MFMDGKKTLRRIALTAGLFALAVLVAFALAFAFVQTDAGKSAVARIAAVALSESKTREVELGRLSGWIPFDFQLQNVSVSDEQGLWLNAQGITVRWSPRAILGGRFYFLELAAQSLKILRMPQGGKKTPAKAPLFPKWTGALHRVEVERLGIERILVGDALVGEQAVFTLEGKIGDSSDGGKRETLLRLEQTDRPGASLAVRALYGSPEGAILAEAGFEEIQGGLIARSLGLEGPLNLSFLGRGSARNLEAELKAQAVGVGLLESQVHLKADEEIHVHTKGMFRLDPAIAFDPYPDLAVGLPFTLSIRIPEKRNLIVTRAGIETRDLSLDFEASFLSEEQTVEGRSLVVFKDLSSFIHSEKADLHGRMKVEGRFSGPLLRPRSSIRVEASDASLGPARASRADALFHLELLGDMGASLPPIRIDGSGVVEGLFLEDSDWLSGKDIAWEFSLLALEEEGVNLSNFLLRSGENSLRLHGTIDPSGPKGKLEVVFESNAVGTVVEPVAQGLPWLGRTVVNGALDGDARAPFLKMQLEGKSVILAEHLPEYILIPEKEISYGASLLLDQTGILKAPRLWLKPAAASLEGEGSFDLEREFVRFSWKALFPDLSRFISVPDLSPKGLLRWTGSVEGPLSSLSFTTEAEAQDVEVAGVVLQKTGARLRALGTPSPERGEFFLELRKDGQPVEAWGDFVLKGRYLHLSNFRLKGLESNVEGEAILDLEGRGAEGKARWKVSDISPLAALAGEEFRGNAKGDAEFSLGGIDQHLIFSLEARSLASPFGTAQVLLLKSRLTGNMDRMKGVLDLEIRNSRFLELALNSLSFKAHGDMHRSAFQLEAKGRYGDLFDAGTSGEFSFSQELQRLVIEHLQIRYGPSSASPPLTLTRPTAVTRENGTMRMEEAAFALGAGNLKWSGEFSANNANFNLDFKDLPLGLLKAAVPRGLTGKASGTFVLEGHPEMPKASFELQAVGVGLQEISLGLPSSSLDLKGSFSHQTLKAEMAFLELTPDPFRASVELPLVFSLVPFSVSLDSGSLMKVTLKGGVPLNYVASIARMHDQKLEGRVEAALRAEGSVGSPRVTGRLAVVEGAYENFRTGTILKEATLLLAVENGRLVIREARAGDGENGYVALDGWLDLSPDRDFRFHVAIALREATLIRNDTTTAKATGDLVFAGNIKGALLSGEVTVHSLEVLIPKRLPPEIADLEIIEIGREDKETSVPETRKASLEPFVKVRITVIMPGRAHLSGRGLVSEWRGKLEIRGHLSALSVTGDLSVVRGHFDFFGKRFNITRGLVSFMGDAPPSPVLEITGEAATKEMTAVLELSGKADSPKLALTSQPALPSDEILSRLLFGRSITQITPFQALQLANALDVLAGRRGLDLIGHTRRMIGLDFLEIKDLGTELDAAAIRAGKYLAENVYMEVQQGLGPETGRASIRWEITPNITVQTEVGVNAEAGAGIHWKWDY